MGSLRWLVWAAALLSPVPAAAQSVDRWSGYIAEASARFGVPEPWIRRVMRAESGGRTIYRGRPIVSRAGAMGLMQLMPGTWREMRAALRLGADPHDPRDNILAGTFYLRLMYDRFRYPGLFAAYNAGPARYAQHLATGRRLPQETVAYVSDVAGGAAPVRVAALPQGPQPPPPTLFVARADRRPAAIEVQASSAPDATTALFVPLTTAPH